jgi:hypothetical protein
VAEEAEVEAVAVAGEVVTEEAEVVAEEAEVEAVAVAEAEAEEAVAEAESEAGSPAGCCFPDFRPPGFRPVLPADRLRTDHPGLDRYCSFAHRFPDRRSRPADRRLGPSRRPARSRRPAHLVQRESPRRCRHPERAGHRRWVQSHPGATAPAAWSRVGCRPAGRRLECWRRRPGLAPRSSVRRCWEAKHAARSYCPERTRRRRVRALRESCPRGRPRGLVCDSGSQGSEHRGCREPRRRWARRSGRSSRPGSHRSPRPKRE